MNLMSNDKIIKAVKCHNCGLIQHYSHLRCLNCKSENFEDIEANGECKLITFTILTAVPREFLEKSPYSLGIVEFENGVKALGQITSQKDLKTGMKLRPIFKEIKMGGKQNHTYFFEPY